jgi:hypothetical protein
MKFKTTKTKIVAFAEKGDVELEGTGFKVGDSMGEIRLKDGKFVGATACHPLLYHQWTTFLNRHGITIDEKEKVYETHIALVPIRDNRSGRKIVETYANEKFNTLKDVHSAFNCIVDVYSLNDFQDLCNDTDDDTEPSEKFDVMEYWVGYIQLLKK